MTSIQSTGYSIHFNEDAYQQLNHYLSNDQISTVFILVDENTHRHCHSAFKNKISYKKEIVTIEIKAGETHKNIMTCVALWRKLTELGADRKSILINLGGGMVTDLGGFVASTFKRGIKFINIPTTLLSMVDASVGSKTGVDLDSLKNLIGMFSNPEMVLIDNNYLQTLSDREMCSGVAEIIKYGLTFDGKLLNEIKQDNWKNINKLNDIIYKSITIKNNIVLQDPKEENLRKVLNYGHTVGHAIESYFLEHDTLENLTHGEAIAIGMVIEAYLSHKLYGFPLTELTTLKEYIHKTFGKTTIATEHYTAILDLMKHDKKNINGSIRYILLKDVSDFIINATAPIELVVEGLNYYNTL
ncbi:MAG: 3-dehydroquinate synthase [Flavobacteriaceae bacterium]|nr:3-dehydroquinate synthase [Flavobacteriaceae bacterium]